MIAAGGQITPTTDTPTITQTTLTTTQTTTGDEQLSALGLAVLDASQDIAADDSTTGEELARGRIDEDEATRAWRSRASVPTDYAAALSSCPPLTLAASG